MTDWPTRWRAARRRVAHRLRAYLLRDQEARLAGLVELRLREQWRAWRALLAGEAPLPPLEEVECRIYSQNGEDGILLYLLALTGMGNRRFVEIGIEDGWECNCINLAKHLGWSGWFVEGSPRWAFLARQHFRQERTLANRDIRLIEAFVERDTIDALLAGHGVGDVDVFSLDIDGMDWWVWQSLEHIRPRIVVVEYNAAFGPERSVTVPYRPGFDRFAHHPSGLYYGASLAALVALGQRKGYHFVGCESAGVNAFFVHRDAAPARLRPLAAAEGFRFNAHQTRLRSPQQQWETIAHLPLDAV